MRIRAGAVVLVVLATLGPCGSTTATPPTTSTLQDQRPSAPVPDTAPPNLPPAKARSFNYAESQRQAAANHPLRTPPTVPASSGPTPGLVDSTQTPIGRPPFAGVNSWNFPQSDGSTTVYVAGAVPSTATRGGYEAAVLAYTEGSPNSKAPSSLLGIYSPTPGPAGAFAVTGSTGSTLTLALYATIYAAPGTTSSLGQYTFDMSSRLFGR
jgi:hypothetical protein